MIRGEITRFVHGAVALWVFLAPTGAFAVAPDHAAPPGSQGAFEQSIVVGLVTERLRIVDFGGNPIRGLGPEDLRVRVGKREVPIVALDWVAEGAGALPAVPSGAPREAAATDVPSIAAPDPAKGRLVVVFVQADLHPSRISGQLRLRPYTRELLGALQVTDRVAVVSFDSHLKLWQDFSSDSVATHAAVDRAMLFSKETPVTASSPDSLAAHFPYAEARDAASPERALELVARAMAALPGEKTVIFLGWGLGRYDGEFGVHMTPEFAPAVLALQAARAMVFVLDVTSADEHSLAVGLESVATATGGLYFSTFRLPQVAARALAHTLSGYYVLTLDRGVLAELDGKVRIDLRSRRGTVLSRPFDTR
ncbi:MAG: hypothetical protein ABI609_01190 [Acidobacteriota bacterium]